MLRVSGGRLALAAAVLIAAAVALSGAVRGGAAYAAGPEPGSAEDPLITKGYFDRYVGLSVVSLPAGSSLVCEAGAEVILRAGKATALGSELGGLADVTNGKDIQTGREVALNHLLIVPRSDGRGLKAATDCTVMVRGPYTVKQ